MIEAPFRYVLGSRSPRRRELLAQIVPADGIHVLPPRESEEAGFAGLTTDEAIRARLQAIARTKCEDVVSQLQGDEAISAGTLVIAGDTTVVAIDRDGQTVVLGQPPALGWEATVRRWFRECYAGRTHRVMTGLCVAVPTRGEWIERIAVTEVTFTADVERWLEWYVATGEPRGKAGGYAIQGAGSVFVTAVRGSLSNVIGLPLEELMNVLEVGTTDAHG